MGLWPCLLPCQHRQHQRPSRQSGDANRVDLLAFGAQDAATVDALASQVEAAGAKMIAEPGTLQTPGGGYGFRFFDPDGRTIEVSSDVETRPFRVLEEYESVPKKLSHVVVNSPNPQAVMEWYQENLGFMCSGWLADWFGFLRCGPDFHTVAIVKGEYANLHHISFELRGYDEWMRGVGRVLGAGTPMPFGLGSHAPASSSFAYFLDPNGNTSEYIIPQEQVVDNRTFDAKVWKGNVSDVWGTARSQNLPEAPVAEPPRRAGPGRLGRAAGLARSCGRGRAAATGSPRPPPPSSMSAAGRPGARGRPW